LNALTGQVTYVDGYRVGRAKVIACYGQLAEAYPQAQRIYAKLWRWLKQEVLKLQRPAEDWRAVRQRVQRFLAPFAHGSQRLLEYVGLLGQGLVARRVHGP